MEEKDLAGNWKGKLQGQPVFLLVLYSHQTGLILRQFVGESAFTQPLEIRSNLVCLDLCFGPQLRSFKLHFDCRKGLKTLAPAFSRGDPLNTLQLGWFSAKNAALDF